MSTIISIRCKAMFDCWEHTATHCNILQHTATHCNTLLLRMSTYIRIRCEATVHRLWRWVLWHTWIRHVAHMHVLCRTREGVVSHTWMSHVTHRIRTWVVLLPWTRHVAHGWVYSVLQCVVVWCSRLCCDAVVWTWISRTQKWDMSHASMCLSCRTHEWVCHVAQWMGHVVHMNASCRTHTWVMLHIHWVMSRIGSEGGSCCTPKCVMSHA